ncbi:MAG: ribosome maturation factor RimM [Candidatus Tectimicrobiota bacterium]
MRLPLILIGAVTRAQGLEGALRVVPYLDEMEAYGTVRAVILITEDRTEVRAVRACRPHGKVLIVELEGVEDRSAAEAYAGARLYVDRGELRDLEAGEFYKEDLLKARVVTETGEPLGTVADFISTGSNDVLVVRGPDGEHLIPLIRSVVRSVDLESRTITVVAPEELYEEPPDAS